MNGERNATWKGMNWIRQDARLAIYLRDRFTCLYCGSDLTAHLPGQLTLDHLDSCEERAVRGEKPDNRPANLVTACARCNYSRGAKPWRDFAPGGAIDRIEMTVAEPLNRALARAILAGEVNLDAESLRGGAGEGTTAG
jgi:hypothetical protein